MKKSKYYAALLFCFMLCACENEADLTNTLRSIENLEKRTQEIEKILSTVNENIITLQKLSVVQEKRIGITSYHQIEDGFELALTDGSKLVLKNGLKNIVNTQRHTDGIIYWTINDEFLRDKNGNMLPVTGKNGKKGVTPKLRINASYQWEVTYNNGISWGLVLNNDGKPIVATGEVGNKGSSDLSISESQKSVVVCFNGKEYILPKEQSNVVENRPKLAIEYFAEYNISDIPGVFATSHQNNAGGYYQNIEKRALHAIPDGYHLPSANEWLAAFPKKIHALLSPSGYTEIKTGVKEHLEIKNDTKTYTSDYFYNPTLNIIYALRFRGHGNLQYCAYRYEMEGEFADGVHDSRWKLKVRYLGNESRTTTQADIMNENYWNDMSVEYITRIFPCSGKKDWKTGIISSLGSSGYYCTSTLNASSYNTAVVEYFSRYFQSWLTSSLIHAYLSVRPVSNE